MFCFFFEAIIEKYFSELSTLPGEIPLAMNVLLFVVAMHNSLVDSLIEADCLLRNATEDGQGRELCSLQLYF